MIKTIKNCSDIESLPLGIASVMAGMASAAYMGNFEVFTASLCLIFMLLLMIFGNLLYRYTLARKGWGDGLERYMTARTARDDDQSLAVTLGAGVTAIGILTAMVGLSLFTMAQDSVWMLAVGALIGIYLYLNFLSPRPLVRTPYSLISTFIMFGPIAVLSVTYIQAIFMASDPVSWQDLSPALTTSFIVGLYGVNVQAAYNLRSHSFDLHHGKKTIVTWLGPKISRNVLIVNGWIAAGIGVYGSLVFPNIYIWMPMAIFIIAAVFNTVAIFEIYNKRDQDVVIYWRYGLNWICAIAMILLFIYAMVWGHPDTRNLMIF